MQTDNRPLTAVSEADLRSAELFRGFTPQLLRECMARLRVVSFARGEVLVRQAEQADVLYVLLDGSVEVLLEAEGKADSLVAVLGRGSCIGELALLLNHRRTATAKALRDTRAIRIGVEDFNWLLDAAPLFGARLARSLASRLLRTTRRQRITLPVEAIAVMPLSADIDMVGFCGAMARGLHPLGLRVTNSIDPAQGDGDLVCIRACPHEQSAGALETLRMSDYVLMVANPDAPRDRARIARLKALLAQCDPRPLLGLALVHRRPPPYHGTRDWIGALGVGSWFQVRAESKPDVARLLRRITGRDTGLVLSGGGARGFAHIGVLKACESRGIVVDHIAGSSMGAVIAALHAAGHSPDAIRERVREAYVEAAGMPDYAIPFVALRNGRASNAKLRSLFGRTRIENLPLAYFCMSSNLNHARAVVHDRGMLWMWARASTSVPGLLPPVRYRGELLVDGGLLDNLPVTEMRGRCRGRIIASDASVATDLLANAPGSRQRMPGLGQILMRSVTLSSVRDSRIAEQPADCYLSLPVDDIGMRDFRRIDEIIARGFEYGCRALEEWQTGS